MANKTAFSRLAKYLGYLSDAEFDMSHTDMCIVGHAAKLFGIIGIIGTARAESVRQQVAARLGITYRQLHQIYWACDCDGFTMLSTRFEAIAFLTGIVDGTINHDGFGWARKLPS